MAKFLALSRVTHGLLDITAAGFCALLWLGDFPPLGIIILSLGTAFAAYAAIYALNDLVGLRCDREKFSPATINRGYAVDGSEHRHPLAQGVLSVRSASIWAALWFGIAVAGSYLLNPVIVLVLVAATALEVSYCRLLKVTYLRTLIGGLVKVSGPLAGVLVVDPRPAPANLLLLLGWLFFWEIGGQNIPSDWNDTVEDRRVGAQTVPIHFGPQIAGLVLLGALGITVAASGLLVLISPARLGLPYVVVSVFLGYCLLLRPASRLVRLREGNLAARLFDSASFYPFSQFALIALFLTAGKLMAIP
jgi:4-hydroxybenzoate polyprenyltransferase